MPLPDAAPPESVTAEQFERARKVIGEAAGWSDVAGRALRYSVRRMVADLNTLHPGIVTWGAVKNALHKGSDIAPRVDKVVLELVERAVGGMRTPPTVGPLWASYRKMGHRLDPEAIARVPELIRAWAAFRGVSVRSLENAMGAKINLPGRNATPGRTIRAAAFDRLCRHLGLSARDFLRGPVLQNGEAVPVKPDNRRLRHNALWATEHDALTRQQVNVWPDFHDDAEQGVGHPPGVADQDEASRPLLRHDRD